MGSNIMQQERVHFVHDLFSIDREVHPENGFCDFWK